MEKKSKRSKTRRSVISVCLVLCIAAFAGCRLSSEPTEVKIYGTDASAAQSAPSQRTDADLAASSGNRPGSTSPGPCARIVCEIKGQIVRPGVYDLEAGSRVHDLVIRAGGIVASGSLDLVNQARKLEDGEVVIVPGLEVTKEEYEAMIVGSPALITTGKESFSKPDKQEMLIDINTADRGLLETIPGIGPVMAQNIIDYRTANGLFNSPEDLKKVDRIGDKTFEKLKAYITVSP